MVTAIELTGKAYYHEREDVDTLKQLVQSIKWRNGVIVNIGVGFGTSMLAMLEAASPMAFVFGIDVNYCTEAMSNLRHYVGHIAHIVGRSHDIAIGWPIKVEMVFVDGSHIKSDVVADILDWRPLIWQGGLIVFDDYDKPICPGVKPAVDQEMKGYREVLHIGDIIAFEV